MSAGGSHCHDRALFTSILRAKPWRGHMATQFTVNGKAVVAKSEPDTPLLWVIRDEVGLAGTKFGCGKALCGACTVLLDGVPVRSCSTPLSVAAGRSVSTVESLSPDNKHPLQKAWIKHDVPQCGYCQSGQLMSAAALLAKQQEPHRCRHRRCADRQHLPLRHLRARARRGEDGCRRVARRQGLRGDTQMSQTTSKPAFRAAASSSRRPHSVAACWSVSPCRRRARRRLPGWCPRPTPGYTSPTTTRSR